MPVLQSRNTNRLQLLMQWNYFKLDENSNASLAMLKKLWLMSSNAIQFVLQSRCHNLFCIVARHLTLASCQPLPLTHPSHIAPTTEPTTFVLYIRVCFVYIQRNYHPAPYVLPGLAWPGLGIVPQATQRHLSCSCVACGHEPESSSSPRCAIPRRTQQAAYLTGNTGCFARTYFAAGVAGEKK